MSKSFPQRFGKYVLLQKIAMGGMAEIFRAKTTGAEGFEREVVIKRILPHFTEDEAFVNMFIDEATLAAKLNHANIVQIFDFDRIDDTYYIAMEYIEGKDLKKVAEDGRKKGRPLSVPQCVRVIVEASKGLHYAHTRKHKNKALNLVHRDVSPHNIMVSYNGEVKLMDFGIAKAASRSTSTQAGTVKGKCAYMAPEQARGGALDGRTDLFALAVVFWELLTGKRLFAGDSDFATLSNVLKCEVEPPSKHNEAIPPELDDLVLKALAKDPDDRFADAGEFGNELQKLLYSTVTDSGQVNLTDFMQSLFEEDIRALEELQENEESMEMPAEGSGTATQPEESEAKTQAIDLNAPPSEARTMALDTGSMPALQTVDEATLAAPGTVTVNARPGAIHGQTGTYTGMPQQAQGGSKTGLVAVVGILLLLAAGGGYFLSQQGTEKSGSAAGADGGESPGQEEAQLSFAVTPSSATVFVNNEAVKGGNFIGKAGDKVVVQARFEGRESPAQTVTLGAGSNAVALTVPAADKKGEKAEEVTITIDAPADVNVRVGSQELGKGRVTLSKVVVGDEILAVAYRDNGEPFEKSFLVRRNEQVVVIPGSKVPEGKVEAPWALSVNPPDAKVTVNGEPLELVEGKGQLKGVFVGDTVKVVVSKSGFSTATRTLKLAQAQGQKAITLSKPGQTAASGTGFVTINAKPWADVYLRGKKLGTTPIRKVKVPAGKQTFTLKQLGTKKRVTVTIKKGETVSRLVDMTQ